MCAQLWFERKIGGYDRGCPTNHEDGSLVIGARRHSDGPSQPTILRCPLAGNADQPVRYFGEQTDGVLAARAQACCSCRTTSPFQTLFLNALRAAGGRF